MASKCVPTQKCGTAVTGWLSSGHPKMTDGIVNGKVCFHWSNSCCMHHQYIKVRNCGRFFVYKLAKAIGCPMRFCGANTGKLILPSICFRPELYGNYNLQGGDPLYC